MRSKNFDTASKEIESEFTMRFTPHSILPRKDKSFGFSCVKFAQDFTDFQKNLETEKQVVQAEAGLRFNEDAIRTDVIHFSTFPWGKLTGMSHARRFGTDDSAPKITIGGTFRSDDALKFTVSVCAHHGLMDGYHVGLFLEAFQRKLDQK